LNPKLRLINNISLLKQSETDKAHIAALNKGVDTSRQMLDDRFHQILGRSKTTSTLVQATDKAEQSSMIAAALGSVASALTFWKAKE